jgi:protein-S-isoprenylcysteine O-methyltransferase Ste14
MILRQAVKMVTLGVVVGLLASLGVSRLMASMLFGVNSYDPLTFVAVAVILAAVALAACYISGATGGAGRSDGGSPLRVVRIVKQPNPRATRIYRLFLECVFQKHPQLLGSRVLVQVPFTGQDQIRVGLTRRVWLLFHLS